MLWLQCQAVAGLLRLLAVILFSAAAFAGPEKLDPFLRLLVHAEQGDGPAALLSPETLSALVALGGDPVAPGPAERTAVRVLLLTEDPGAAWTIPGFRPHQVVNTLATGEVAVADLAALADHPQVVYIEASRPLSPSLDVSVPEVGAPALWYGTPATAGRGVILGVVDTGLDILHHDFRVDRDGNGTEEGSRILWLWDQTGVGATGFPSWWGNDGVGAETYYGRAFSRAELEGAIARGSSPTLDSHGHGTHVAGIAAGDGSASAAMRRGVAPDADLVVVKTTFYHDTVVDGARFVFEAAEALGMPAVVNLSLGGHSGPHDGSSLFERMLDELVDRPGRAIVVAAGNEGDRRIHVGGDIWTPTTWHLEAEKDLVSAQFWYNGTATYSIEVRSPSGETATVLPGSQRWVSTSSGGIWLDNTSLPDPRNLARYIYVALTDVTPGTTWAVTLTPILGGGRVDGWVEDAAAAQFGEGDTSSTICEPGNATRVITVGAYITKTHWTSVAGEETADGEVGALASFSSRGPTRDGRLKPDLTAPGAWIASARSQNATAAPWLTLTGGEYTMLLGTSMAAPHVAGAVALLFSRRPNLTWAEVKDALTSGARADAQVGVAPSQAWGAGKLDIARAAQLSGGAAPVERPVLIALANPVSAEARFSYRCPTGTGWASLHIYDLAGKLLYTQLVGPLAGEARWPLTTHDGRRVASGLYLAVLVTDKSQSEIVRVVVQR
mgnify:FL=1